MPLQPARLLILFLNDRWAYCWFGIPYDIGQITEEPAFPITNRQYYGNVPQGSIYGRQSLGIGLGVGLAPVRAGLLWDVTGTCLAPLLVSLGSARRRSSAPGCCPHPGYGKSPTGKPTCPGTSDPPPGAGRFSPADTGSTSWLTASPDRTATRILASARSKRPPGPAASPRVAPPD